MPADPDHPYIRDMMDDEDGDRIFCMRTEELMQTLGVRVAIAEEDRRALRDEEWEGSSEPLPKALLRVGQVDARCRSSDDDV